LRSGGSEATFFVAPGAVLCNGLVRKSLEIGNGGFDEG
jgi:hypothetical protein